MRTKLTHRLVALVLAGSGLGLAVSAAQAEWACTAYEHRDYGGASRGLAANHRSGQTQMNDKISSFKIVQGCRVVAYEHANFSGPNAVWRGDVPFIGANWNDLISSWECKCP